MLGIRLRINWLVSHDPYDLWGSCILSNASLSAGMKYLEDGGDRAPEALDKASGVGTSLP